MNQVHTYVDILRHMEKSYSNPLALNWRENGVWHSFSTQEFLLAVRYVALGLCDMGLQPGEHIGILAHSSPHWTIVDFAIMIAGGVSVPLFASISDEHFSYEVEQTEIKLLFVGGTEQWWMLQRHSKLFNLIIAITPPPANTNAYALQELMERGKQLDMREPQRYAQLCGAITPESVGTIIYTSGSTGVPKGVELTQENMACLVHDNPYSWNEKTDRYLSLLPLEHVFGHCVNLWMIYWGVSIYYTSDYKIIATICEEIKPTAMVVVPRLLEKIHGRMLDKVHDLKGFKHLLAKWAFALADQLTLPWYKKILLPLFDLLVYSKFREGLGGEIRVVISGGAPLDSRIHTFFERIKIPVYEGWGMTEACPITVNRPHDNIIGSVGKILADHQMKLTPEGEILIKGPLVMRGYYRNSQETAKGVDSEGWLHTGDRGSIDSVGHLKILGRIKELYKTSTGEYVAPIPIEQAICRHPLVETAMVVAEGRKFATCLLFPNAEALQRLKNKHKTIEVDDEAFLKSPYVTVEIHKLLSDVNTHLNHCEQIRAYRFIMKPLTIKDGELTPSMKIRRQFVANKYSKIIDAMYHEEAKV